MKAFIRAHSTSFDALNKRQSQLLEMGALALAAEHYRVKGYNVCPRNLQGGAFRVKLSTRGDPRNYSWFRCERESTFELHANPPVMSNYGLDEGRYVVDVGVITEGVWGRASRKELDAVPNQDLITFIEAKRLVVYPMLIAQFIGIVHEIKPGFLGGRRPWGFVRDSHFDPALVAIGYLHATSFKINRALPDRGFRIQIAPAFDRSIAQLRGRRGVTSPLDSIAAPWRSRS